MTALKIYQVDAFTSEVFGGNPAAVCPLKEWLSDEIMLNIAMENNLSETAFFVPNQNEYEIRWFTPTEEVDLCGHATLATAYVIFNQLNHPSDVIHFESRFSGALTVYKKPDGLMMDFPVWAFEEIEIPDDLSEALGKKPAQVFKGNDWVAVYPKADDVRRLDPNFSKLTKVNDARGIIATARGENGLDFVSRAFFPKLGIPEDPVTGSAHCILTPIWAQALGKTKFKAQQISKRGGDLVCELKGDRVKITGQAALYMEGMIYV